MSDRLSEMELSEVRQHAEDMAEDRCDVPLAAEEVFRLLGEITRLRAFAQSTLYKLTDFDPRETMSSFGDLNILLESIRRDAMEAGATMEKIETSNDPEIPDGCDPLPRDANGEVLEGVDE